MAIKEAPRFKEFRIQKGHLTHISLELTSLLPFYIYTQSRFSHVGKEDMLQIFHFFLKFDWKKSAMGQQRLDFKIRKFWQP